MTPDFLAKAREAVWEAVSEWPAFNKGGQSFVRKKYTFEEAITMLATETPAPSDLPALAIFPSDSVSQVPHTNQTKEFPYVLDVFFWTNDWLVKPAELMIGNFMMAMFQSKDATGNRIIRARTCREPSFRNARFARVKLGKEENAVRAVRAHIQVVLTVKYAPYTSS